MRLSHIRDEVADSTMRAHYNGARAIGHTPFINSACLLFNCMSRVFPELYQSFSRLLQQLQFGITATLTTMAQQMSLSSNPEQLLQFMDEMDSDFSDVTLRGTLTKMSGWRRQ